ncbi:MAG: carbohydrate-binding protein [Planctomycetota bacterium]|nr:carbohydrate-binding protein [Planctomycetota bacterium]
MARYWAYPVDGVRRRDRVKTKRIASFRAFASAISEPLEQRLLLAAVMVKDLNIDTLSSTPSQFTNVNATAYFTATSKNVTGGNVYGLWKSDGTPGGTAMIPLPLATLSAASNLIAFNGNLFLVSDQNVIWDEIWKSDGTPEGTVRVTDFPYVGSAPAYLNNINGTLFFQVDDGKVGSELWKTDGTWAGTVLVKDIRPGTSGSSISKKLVDVNGTAFFSANNGTSGVELWKSDGTEAGTVLVKDVNPGANKSSSPGNLTNVNGVLFFTADDGTNGVELWKSDGTDGGTVLVKNINPTAAASSSPTELVNVNGKLFFAANNGSSGVELWKSDGTAGGTVLVKDINSGSAASTPHGLVNLNGKLIFAATDASGGAELFASDGTSGGTARIKDIRPGAASADPAGMIVLSGKVYFSADDGSSGVELWATDGTAAGTVRVSDIKPGSGASSPTLLTRIGSKLFFSATNGHCGAEPFVSDGTVAGTMLLKDIESQVHSSGPRYLTAMNGSVYFGVTAGYSDYVSGRFAYALAKSDGTADGTVLVKNNLDVTNLININGTLFFTGRDMVSGEVELWKSNGTAAGTVRVKDIFPGAQSSMPENMVELNGKLIFTATNGTKGVELWKSDGTAAGTVMLRDINTSGDSNPRFLTNVNGTVYFFADDGVHDIGLWKTDGTTAGTVRVMGNQSGPMLDNDNTAMISFNGMLYFVGYTYANGRELWRTDGTAAGTVMVKDISPGEFNGIGEVSDLDHYFAVVGQKLYIMSVGPKTKEVGIWMTDGTTEGTIPVCIGSYGRSLFNNDGKLLFVRYNYTDNWPYPSELWTTDGTPEGTLRVKALGAVEASKMLRIADTIYFTVNDGKTPTQVWQTDGTEAGTISSTAEIPTELFYNERADVNGNLFFARTDDDHGNELWRYSIDLAGPTSLTATASTISTAVTLKWAHPLATETAFVIERKTGSQPFAPIGTAPAGARTFLDATTAPATQYVYRVLADTPSGLSLYSNEVSAITSGVGPPAAPSDLGATVLTDSRIQLKWADNSFNEIGFLIERKVGADGAFQPLGTIGPGTTSYLDTDLAAATLYTYRIIAAGEVGNSPPSNDASVTTFSATTQSPFTGFPVAVPGAIQFEDFDNGGDGVAYHDLTAGNLGGQYRDTGVDIQTTSGGYTVGFTEPGEWLEYTFKADIEAVYNLEIRVSSAGPGGTFHVEFDGSLRTGPISVPDSRGAANYLTVTAAGIPLTIGQHRMRLIMDTAGPGATVGNFDFVRLIDSATVKAFEGFQSLVATQTGPSQVQISWQVQSHTETAFLIERRVAPLGRFEPLAQVDANVMSYTDTTAVPGTSYAYRIYAVNSRGMSNPGADLQPNTPVYPSSLLIDLNAAPDGSFNSDSNPSQMTPVGPITFFSATSLSLGTELFVTDGTATGTTLLKDINPGSASSNPTNLVAVGGQLFFVATNPVAGTELWTSDGTASGTQLLKDIYPGTASSSPANLVNFNGVLYFTAQTSSGRELWKSDGTAAGTVMVKDIDPGAGSSDPRNLTIAGGKLFFTASQLSTGRELWVTDGTTSGTVLLRDIQPGDASSGISLLTTVGQRLFFVADDAVHGQELWYSNGTASGTQLVRDINPGPAGSSPQTLTNFNGMLLFTASDVEHGSELWKSNGVASGTVLVKDIYPGTGGALPQSLSNVNGQLLFTATDPEKGTELWRSNGTEGGTVRVRDINPGPASSLPVSLTDVNGTLFFIANDGVSRHELWKTDGTENGTILVKDIYPGATAWYTPPTSLISAGGMLFLTAYSPAGDPELWESDGTAAGTMIVRDINAGPIGSFPQNLTVAGAVLYFSATDTVHGRELWLTDGTERGTVLLQDIAAQTKSAIPGCMINLNGAILFVADDGINGYGLWKTDGTAESTTFIKTIGDPGIVLEDWVPVNVNGTIFFRSRDRDHGEELWKTDGTAAGTGMVKDIIPGTDSSYPWEFFNANGTLLFIVNDPVNTDIKHLWRSDGTEAGTYQLGDAMSVGWDDDPYNDHRPFVEAGGTVFFAGWDQAHGSELWATNGTIAGTHLVKDLRPGPNESRPWRMANVDGRLFAFAWGVSTYDLWTSDATEAGTVIVRQFPVSPNYDFAENLVSARGMLFFDMPGKSNEDLTRWRSDGAADGTVTVGPDVFGSGLYPGMVTPDGASYFGFNASSGWRLYKTDGTLNATVLLLPIGFVPADYRRRPCLPFAAVNGTVYAGGIQSDGTVAGTFRYIPKLGDYDVIMLAEPVWAVLGNTLIVAADDGMHGWELWRVDTLPAAPCNLAATGPDAMPITLTWVDASNNETAFQIERKAAGVPGESGYVTIGTVAAGVTRYTDTTAAPGDHYSYRVRAINSAGRSEPSNELVVTTALAAFAGTPTADSYYIRLDPSDAGFIQVFKNAPPTASPTYTLPLGSISTLSLNAGDGNDTITLDFSGGTPIPAGGLSVSGGLGDDVLRMIGTTDADVFTISDTRIRLGDVAVWYSDLEHVQIDGGGGDDTLSITTPLPFDPLLIGDSVHASLAVNAGTYTFAGSQQLGLLSIANGATAALAAGDRTLCAGAIHIAPLGELDVNTGNLVLRAGGDEPSRVLDRIAAWIKSARGSDARWLGAGLTSSAARTNGFAGVAAIINENGDKQNPLYTDFAGMRVALFDILVRYTWNGDANLDGVVNTDDFFQIDSGIISQKKGWYHGDFNYDGVINADDYFLIDSAYIGQSGPLAASKPALAVWADVAVQQKPEKADPDGILSQLFSLEPVL